MEDIASIVRDNFALIIVKYECEYFLKILPDMLILQTKSSGESLIQRSYELNNNKCKVTMAEKLFYSRPQTYSFAKGSNLTCPVDFE